MLTLLLADDEAITRQGICNIIPWNELGIGKVLQAANGQIALEMIKQEKVEVLLTDVKMPVMDGIALARQVRRQFPEVRVIFISGYAEVAYLKAAVHEQAVDYILKPINQDELAQAVGKAVTELNHQRENQVQQEGMRYLIKKSLPFYRMDFFARLLASDSNVKALQEQFALCDFPFAATDSFITALVSLKCRQGSAIPDISLLSTEAEELLIESVKAHAVGYVYRNNKTLFTLVLSVEACEEIPLETYENLLNALSDKLSLDCSVGVGTECKGIYNIGESCQCAEAALSRQFREGMGKVYFYDENEQGENLAFSANTELLDRFCSGVLSQSREISREAIYELTEELGRREFVNMNYFYSYCLYFVSAVLSRLCAEKEQLTVMHLDLLIRCQTMLLNCKTVVDIRRLLSSLLDDLFLLFSKSSRSQGEMMAKSVMAFLETHYREDITIQSISGELYITPAYLCRLFKKETGKTINEYLTQLRIQKGKELLKLGQFHLYDIAPMVGYQDNKYFSRIFKSRTGLNPSEYARIHRE